MGCLLFVRPIPIWCYCKAVGLMIKWITRTRNNIYACLDHIWSSWRYNICCVLHMTDTAEIQAENRHLHFTFLMWFLNVLFLLFFSENFTLMCLYNEIWGLLRAHIYSEWNMSYYSIKMWNILITLYKLFMFHLMDLAIERI